LAGAVGGLLADPDLAARMGAAGRVWASEHWRWDQLSQRLQTLIDG
jgi:phosphatidylinositol alpha-1,6-mannosyltransferase